MKYLGFAALLAALVADSASLKADSIWERRNPNFAYFYKDTVARRVGDVLTVSVREVTLFDGKEDRKMNRDHKDRATFDIKGNSKGNENSRTLNGSLEGGTTSVRSFNGKADYKSDRTFSDKIAVMVIDVMPNGNLIIQGTRQRMVANELKMLVISGIVRPQDIGPDNVVQSQFIANFEVKYQGRGPESHFTNQNWLSKAVNKIWPF